METGQSLCYVLLEAASEVLNFHFCIETSTKPREFSMEKVTARVREETKMCPGHAFPVALRHTEESLKAMCHRQNPRWEMGPDELI